MSYSNAVFTSKGQVVIPAPVRRRHGIRKGTNVMITEDGTRIILQPVTRQFIHSLRGSLKGRRCALDVLLRERRKDHSF